MRFLFSFAGDVTKLAILGLGASIIVCPKTNRQCVVFFCVAIGICIAQDFSEFGDEEDAARLTQQIEYLQANSLKINTAELSEILELPLMEEVWARAIVQLREKETIYSIDQIAYLWQNQPELTSWFQSILHFEKQKNDFISKVRSRWQIRDLLKEETPSMTHRATFSSEKWSGNLIWDTKDEALWDKSSFYLTGSFGGENRIILGDFQPRVGMGLLFWDAQFSEKTTDGKKPFKPLRSGIKTHRPTSEKVAARGLVLELERNNLSSQVFSSRKISGVQVFKEFSNKLRIGGYRTNFNKDSIEHAALGGYCGYSFAQIKITAEVGKIDSAFGKVIALCFSDDLLRGGIHFRKFDAKLTNPFSGILASRSRRENETGLYGTIYFRPISGFDHTVFVDIFQRLDPADETVKRGKDFSYRVRWKIGESRLNYRVRMRTQEILFDTETTFGLEAKSAQEEKKDAHYLEWKRIFLNTFRVKIRADYLCYILDETEKGFSGYCEIRQINGQKKWLVRWLRFATDSYNSRIYLYEYSVPGRFDVPSVYGNGWRINICGWHDISDLASVSAKISYQTTNENPDKKLDIIFQLDIGL